MLTHSTALLHYKNGKLVLLAAKLLDNVIITGEEDSVTNSINGGFTDKLKFGKIVLFPVIFVSTV